MFKLQSDWTVCRVFVCMFVCVRVCACVHLYVCMWMCACMCMWVHAGVFAWAFALFDFVYGGMKVVLILWGLSFLGIHSANTFYFIFCACTIAVQQLSRKFNHSLLHTHKACLLHVHVEQNQNLHTKESISTRMTSHVQRRDTTTETWGQFHVEYTARFLIPLDSFGA